MTNTFKLKGIVMEDFCNYQKPSMFLISSICNWKCCIEQNLDISICQNSPVAQQPSKDIPIENLYKAYVENPITRAIVLGGLEPLMQMEEVVSFIDFFRSHKCSDDIVIYTGYTEEEFYKMPESAKISSYDNIIIKYGRFIPNHKAHLDPILGVELASDNQYARRL